MKSMFTASVTNSLWLLALVLALTPGAALGQGSLTPPGAPAPTMKTLTQVEPRTPIDSLPCIIDQSGSYYLTSNLTAAPGVNGISVAADHVTIDLGGFALLGGGGAAAAGINVPAAQRDLNVRNGTIASWSGQGILASNAHNSQFEHLRIASNGSVGLQAGQACAIRDCVLEANQGDGINAAERCLIKDCESSGNSNGFQVQGNGTRITDCVAADNTLTGIVVTGVIGTITTCTATSNGQDGINVGSGCRVDQCTVIINGRHGIFTQDGCTVKNCTANGNVGDGIQVGLSCCWVNGNTTNGNVIGIHSTGNARIDDNIVYSNGTGILCELNAGSFVVRNTAHSNNVSNYDVRGGNNFAMVVNNPGMGFANQTPWSNFSY